MDTIERGPATDLRPDAGLGRASSDQEANARLHNGKPAQKFEVNDENVEDGPAEPAANGKHRCRIDAECHLEEI